MVSMPELDMLTAEQQAIYHRFSTNLTKYLVLTTASANPYLDLAVSFRYSTLSPKDRETVIVRVGGQRNCAYELMQHVHIAKSAGVDQTVIEKLLDKSDTVFGEPKTDKLIAYVDAALDNAVTPEIIAALGEHFDDTQVAEIALLTGHYVMTAIFLQSLAVPLDPEPASWDNLLQKPVHQ